MMRVLLLMLLVWGSDATAQALRVRSGEHDGYTRIVVQVPAGTGWNLTQHTNGARLTVGIDGVTFDTRAVFDRLSASRLQSLSQAKAGGPLDLEFGCECVANAFLHRDSMVVIDISPGSNATATLPDLPLSARERVTPPAEIPATELALPLLQLDRGRFEDQLISRIIQGADREVVDLNLADVGRRSSTAYGPLRMDRALSSNLKLRSVLDEIEGLEALEVPQLEPRTECITDSELGFDNWSNETPFAVQVAGLRVGLFQEFDRVDETHALKLARLYTYHGFGAEALQALNLLPDNSTQQEQLSAIAFVMDDLSVPLPNPFAGQQQCVGGPAFWAVMTERTLDPDANLDAIEQYFGRLPRHLRRHLGAKLSEILVNAGELEASRRVLRSVARVLNEASADVDLAKAETAAAAGENIVAEKLLSDVVSSAAATAEAPLALARLVEKRWADRGAVSPADLDLAASYARQLRRSDLGPMMARAHVLALALSQEFDAALNQIRAAPDTSEWQRAQDQVLQLLAERADDITFLRHTVGMPDQTRSAISVDTAVSLATRLADLRFAAPAYALAARPQDRKRRFDRAQLRARAALLQNKPRQALLEIAGDESDEAEQLRARAISQTDDYAEAARLLRAIGDGDAADRYAWLTGDPDIGAETPSAFGEIRQISARLTQTVDRQPDKPLADAAGLLKDSATARGRIAELLERVQVQRQTGDE